MPTEPHLAADRKSSALVLAALIAPLLFVAGMYLMSRRTERMRQATIDGALKDYAAVAAWQLAARLGEAIHQDAMKRLGGRRQMGAANPNCAACARHAHEGRGAFAFDPQSGGMTWADSLAPDSAYQRAVVSLVSAELSRPSEEPHRVLFAAIGGRDRILLLTTSPDDRRVVSGIDADSSVFDEAIQSVLSRSALLPGSLVKPPFGPEQLYVRVARADGKVVFENAPPTTLRLAATDTMEGRWGGLAITVALKPALASKLVVGAAPRSMAGPFTLLLALSSFLAVAAIAQLRRSRELARLRTQFVASVSHELRTPLTHISMFAETLMLSRERSDDERRKFASVIFREARRLSTLVESVLRFARAEVERNPLHLEPRNLPVEVADVLAAFEPIARASSSTVTLEESEDVRAIIDPSAFRQIMLNLLDNAVKYGPEGQEIRVRVVRSAGEAIVMVEDCGPGIPHADHARVFEPFVRLTSNARRGGTGIGLSVVRELTVAQAGRVWVENREEGGARVCVALPVAPLESTDTEVSLAAPRSGAVV